MRSKVLVLAACLGLAACSGGEEALPRGTLRIHSDGRDVVLAVEIPETTTARTKGLMGREELAENAGMAWVFDRPVHDPFSMENTTIRLSIAFWGENGRILQILDMNPCTEEPCRLYEPDAPFSGAVEVNQGFFEEHGVAVGDRVELERSDVA